MNRAVVVDSASVVIDGQTILNRISAEIPAGSITGLIGPSGAGKTTLIRAIVGRLRLSQGNISVLGLPSGSAKVRHDIGYMTQALSIYPDLTVTENLRFFAAMVGANHQAIKQVLEQVDLTPQAKQLASTLSGGQKSRLSLAVALLGKPKLLVLDEPTVGVDPVLRKQLWELFGSLAADGATVLVTSHVMDEADHCQDLMLIRDGKLLIHGTPDELRQRTGASDIEQAFLKLVEAGE